MLRKNSTSSTNIPDKFYNNNIIYIYNTEKCPEVNGKYNTNS